MPTNALRYWRIKRGPTITSLADSAGVSTRLITKIEADPNYIAKADTMEQLAHALNLPIFVVFFQEDYKKVRHALFNQMRRQIMGMSPDGLFNTFRHGLDALQDEPWPFEQPDDRQLYSRGAASPPRQTPFSSKS